MRGWVRGTRQVSIARLNAKDLKASLSGSMGQGGLNRHRPALRSVLWQNA